MPQFHKKVINVPNAFLTNIKYISEKKDHQRNKIQIAFDSRVLENVFTGNRPYNISMADKEDGSAIDQLGILIISIGEDDEERVLPSHLLSNDRGGIS